MSTAVERVRECYKTVTTVFGAGGTMYTGGHRGADYRSYDGEAIIAWDDMVIESIDYGTGLGPSLGVRCLNAGGYAGWAHVKGIQGGVGTRIPYGGTLAFTAGWGDAHGTLWTGPHIHTTRGFESAYNCSVGIRPLVDPVPAINAAKAGTAGGGSTPLEDDMNADQDARLKNIEAILVGTGPSIDDPTWMAGGGSIMGRIQNLSAHLFGGGPSTSDPKYMGAPGTVYALLKSPVHRVIPDPNDPTKNVSVQISQIQDNADTNTMVRTLLNRPAVSLTNEQVELLAASLKDAGLGGLTQEEVQAAVGMALAGLVLQASFEASVVPEAR